MVQVSVFAGGFTLNSLLTLDESRRHVETLLAVAFILFSLAMFLAIYARMFVSAISSTKLSRVKPFLSIAAGRWHHRAGNKA
jgi:hypothetical protein